MNIYEAKTHLSRLLADVEGGADVVIARHGRPIARIVPFVAHGAARVPGRLAGQIRISDDFDDFNAQDETAWYGAAL